MLECEWCGNKCDNSVGFMRETRMTLLDGSESVEGPWHSETRFFCSRAHRHEYLYGM